MVQRGCCRSAIGDSGDQKQWIRTIARKGFRFVGEIREERGPGDSRAASPPPLAEENALPVASAVPAAPHLPDKPSIAVLAFTNMSDDPAQEYFSDGITEDIITGLSRFSELFVIARNSSFQYKGKSPDIRQVGRELGVRYVLEGSIRRVDDRVRISAQLIDAVTGGHRWAERYDRELKDVFAVQDEVSRAVIAILVAQVNKAEAERTLLKPPATWQAHDFFLRASDIFTGRSSLKLNEARQLLERSISLDPSYARAYATLSQTHLAAWLFRLDEDYLSPAALERAHQLAWKAVQLDPSRPCPARTHPDLRGPARAVDRRVRESRCAEPQIHGLAIRHDSASRGRTSEGHPGSRDAHAIRSVLCAVGAPDLGDRTVLSERAF
jgi:adenylate cyclase